MKIAHIHTVVLYVVLAVLSFFLFQQFQRNAELKNEKESVSNFLKDTVSYYQNRLGQEIAHKEVLRGDKQTLEVLLSEKTDSLGQLKRLVENFRRVNVAGNITTETRIDTVKIPYEVPIPEEFTRDFEKHDEHYSITGISTNHGLTINNLTIPNTLSFAIGDRKTGLFSSEYRIEAVNSNPHVTTTGMDTYTVKTNKGIVSIDVQAGYGMTTHGPSPYVGVGLSLDLWSAVKLFIGDP